MTDLVTDVEDLLNEMICKGGKPYSIVCPPDIYEKLVKELHSLTVFEENYIPDQMFFKMSYGDIPIIKYALAPKDYIYVLDEEGFKILKKEMEEWEKKK